MLRYSLLVAGLVLGACRGAPAASARSTAAAVAPAAPTLFSDSAVYRARCQEADTIRTLKPVPQRCTPRDQRLPARVF